MNWLTALIPKFGSCSRVAKRRAGAEAVLNRVVVRIDDLIREHTVSPRFSKECVRCVTVTRVKILTLNNRCI